VVARGAGTALKQTVFKTRASLGQGLVVTTAGGYALGAMESDVEVFLLGRPLSQF
jgi:hypothetical protein